ncbi:hypothetical protein NEF87_004544 [Candidatus Lokiarchaeum ossiferum]|uniref:Uncharacterized protein n=1 Tax=Candidatus Lokiarchaeum ossiferum TaxID=2951803 RepID=A0ABY6I0B7_9ARCH|nr:hypothetical protein NEF87_004544 [Candidatus Lokiarchaeum sp. B-35]
MVSEQILMFVEIGNSLFGFIGIYLAIKQWKKYKNPADIFVVLINLLAVGAVLFSAFTFLLIGYFPEINLAFKIGNLPIEWIFKIGISMMYMIFMVYLLEWKFLYTVPFIVGLYFFLYGFHTGNENILNIYLGTIIFSAIWLIYNAIKNRSGLSLGLFIVAVFYAISTLISDFLFLYYLFRYLMSISLILGINGWFEEKILYNRKEEKKIQNTWIARATRS